MGERAPQHVQNIVLRDYCAKRGHELLLAATEYAMPDSFMILESVLDDLASVDGIVFYSLYQLPTIASRYGFDKRKYINLNSGSAFSP